MSASLASAECLPRREIDVTARLRWLVAVNLVVATAFAWTPLLPLGQPFVALQWAALGVAAAPMMLLALWCSLGTSIPARRILGGLLGTAYLAGCSLLREVVSRSTLQNSWPAQRIDKVDLISHYGGRFLSSLLLIGIFVAIFWASLLVVRRWVGSLQHFDRPDDRFTVVRSQYSLVHLFLVVSAVGVCCGLSRAACFQWPDSNRPDWQGLAQQGLFVLAFLTITIVAARSTLLPGPVRGRIWRGLAISAFVGAIYSVAMPSGDLAWWVAAWWWILLCGVLLIGLPAAVLVANLRLIRSCGYRLVAPAKQCRS